MVPSSSARGWPLLGLLLSFPALGQAPPGRLADLNQQLTPNADSAPHGGIEFGAYTFYRARNDRLGWRIWRTELATGRTDLVPQAGGVTGSEFADPLVVGTRLVFHALGANLGDELVVIDDPGNPVPRVLDLRPGRDSAFPRSFTAFQGDLFFTAYDAVGTWGLWRSDPSLTAATRIQVLQPAPGSIPSTSMAVLGNRLVFTGSTTFADFELWTTDGTPAGTFPVADIHPGPQAGSSPASYRVVGNQLYFIADDGVHGRELWRSDGTPSGTALVRDVNPGSGPGLFDLHVAGSRLVFAGYEPATGTELWVSDGTTAGTRLLLDFHVGADGSTYAWFRSFGDCVVFSVGSIQQGSEPWITDGTLARTHALVDAWPGTLGSFPSPIGEATPTLFFFRTSSPQEGAELWKTDGTSAGTLLVRDILPGPSSSDAIGWTAGGRAYVQANDGTYGIEPWVSDGTAAGTRLLMDINPVREAVNSSYPANFVSTGTRLFFSADDGVVGNELYVSDDQGTRLVADVNPGAAGSAIREITALGDRVFFRAAEPVTGYELWTSDGTAAGTQLVRDIAAGSEFATPNGLTALGDRLVFAAFTPAYGTELWCSDGTNAGTRLLLDVRGGPAGSNPAGFVRIGDRVYFHANDGATGMQLWCTDGTTAGTARVSAIASGVTGILPPFQVGTRTLLVTSDGTNGVVLWEVDGTTSGTRLVRVLSPPGFQARIEAVDTTATHGYLALVASSRPELWVTDGTSVGTALVQAFGLAERWPQPRALAGLEHAMLFRIQTHAEGIEPWVSDGTAAGTQRLGDLVPGPGSSLDGTQSLFHVIAGRWALFAATTPNEGREPWLTDGTVAGTRRLADLDPGPWDGMPIRPATGSASDVSTWIGDHRGRTIFGATDGVTGVEPWAFSSGLATTFALGRACSPGGMPPHLRAMAPILGANLHVTIEALPPASTGVTLVGLPVLVPLVLTATCRAYLDPAVYAVLDRFSSLAGGTYGASFLVPNDPALQDESLVIQAFLVSTGAHPGLSATEAILAIFGI